MVLHLFLSLIQRHSTLVDGRKDIIMRTSNLVVGNNLVNSLVYSDFQNINYFYELVKNDHIFINCDLCSFEKKMLKL